MSVIVTLVFVYIVNTLGIILPRKLAERKPERWAYRCVKLVYYLEFLFIPILFLTDITTKGVVINGEFVAADKNLYKSTEDAGFGYKSKVQGKKGGNFALEQEIVQAMMSSRYFQHIYAENIEQYINYPADNRALVELIEPSKKPKTQTQQQIGRASCRERV